RRARHVVNLITLGWIITISTLLLARALGRRALAELPLSARDEVYRALAKFHRVHLAWLVGTVLILFWALREPLPWWLIALGWSGALSALMVIKWKVYRELRKIEAPRMFLRRYLTARVLE